MLPDEKFKAEGDLASDINGMKLCSFSNCTHL